MAQITIIAKNNSIVVNGLQCEKGRLSIAVSDDTILINNLNGTLSEVTINGNSYGTMQEFVDAADELLFEYGGGDGSGVTWDQVTGKPLYTLGTPIQDAEGLIPVYTQSGQLPVGMPEFPENAVPLILLDVRAPELEEGNFLVGGEDGNRGRKILPPDLGLTSANRIPVSNVGLDGFASLFLSQNVINQSLVQRTPTGKIKAADATLLDDLVTLNQFQGIVNDTLTSEETSASLNASYASAVVGTIVTTQIGLTEYRKIAPSVWSKKTIEIV